MFLDVTPIYETQNNEEISLTLEKRKHDNILL